MSEEEIIEALNEIAARFREQHLCGYEHVVNAVALIVQQQAQIARVRELHRYVKVPVVVSSNADGSLPAINVWREECAECRVYPCSTLRALDGVEAP